MAVKYAERNVDRKRAYFILAIAQLYAVLELQKVVRKWILLLQDLIHAH